MTAEQTDLFDSNRDLADRAARKYPIAGEDEDSMRQEALIGLGKAVLAYDPAKGPFDPFAWQVIKNHLHSAYRSAKHRQFELLTLDENPDESQEADTKKDGIPDREPTPAREAERSEIRVALQDGLASLTPSQRAVLEQYAKGVSFAEVARDTGASEQAVRQMFQRGVNQMRPHLESRGVGGPKFMPGSSEPGGSGIFTPPFHKPLEKQPKEQNVPRGWVVFVWVFLAAILIWLAWTAGFFR
jgi:RNA polymerase sigma factor (sigma-70 family)